MAKNYELIPGERNNWEVSIFLLIDYFYVSSSRMPHISFTRTDIHSSIKSLNFIEKLLGPLGYVVDKTLSNSMSSAITRLDQKGYLKCEDGECILTNEGVNRLQEIKDKYEKNNEVAIGKNRKVFDALKSLDPETRKTVIEKFDELSSK